MTRLGRYQAAPVARFTRARDLLVIADEADYKEAADAVGRNSGDVVSVLMTRFIQEGLDALRLHDGGGRHVAYDERAQARILQEIQSKPTGCDLSHAQFIRRFVR